MDSAPLMKPRKPRSTGREVERERNNTRARFPFLFHFFLPFFYLELPSFVVSLSLFFSCETKLSAPII